MKKIFAGTIAIMLLLSAFFLFSACDTLTAQEGADILAEAYENSVTKWGDIYQYHEKVTKKAVVGQSGYITDSVVNVHCFHDGEEYHKDKDLALTINDQYYISVMDEGGKETSTLKGSNALTAVLPKRHIFRKHYFKRLVQRKIFSGGKVEHTCRSDRRGYRVYRY